MHGANIQRYGPMMVHEDFRSRPVLVLDVCGVLLAEPMAPLFRAVSEEAGTSSDRVEAIARAAAIWRPLAPDSDTLARDGLHFLRDLFSDGTARAG